MKLRLFAAPFATLVTVASLGMLVHGEVPGVPTGQWLAGPALAQPRAGAVSVALDDGRVLVIGGRTADGPVTTVDVFETDGSIDAGPPLAAARVGHAVVKLADGRVLVTAGTTIVTVDTEQGPVTKEAATASAEIFDPVANSWSQAAQLLTARSGHTATAIADGRVLIAGGVDADRAALDSLEVFNPESGAFASGGILSAARTEHAAAVAAATKVLVAGGRNANGVSNTADIIDLDGGSVSTVVLTTPRASASATTLLDGRILVAGGSDGMSDLASAELIDPATGVASPTGSMAQARRGHQALLLDHNATVLIVGGTSAGVDVPGAEQFLAWSDEFLITGSPAAARGMPAVSNVSSTSGVALLAAGKVAATELFGFATVHTDREDYSPGMTVTMFGGGWQPGETVTLDLRELPGEHSARTFTAVADASGRITNTDLVLEQHHLGVRFFLTARGAASQAQVTFTDGTLRFLVSNSGATFTGSYRLFNTTNCSAASTTGSGSVTASAGTTLSVLTTASQSVRITAPTSVTSAGVTWTFVNWNGPDGFAGSNAQLCAPGVGGGQDTYIATYTASTVLAVNPASGPFGGTVNLSATLTSGGTGVNNKTITFELNGNSVGSAKTNNSGVATLNGASLTGINGGVYASGVGASFAGDTGYTATSASAALTVIQNSQAITVTTNAPSSAVYNSTFPVAATGGASGNPVVIATAGVCSGGGNGSATITMTTGTGTCTITFNQAGDGTYEAAPQITQSVTAATASSTTTVTFEAGPYVYRGFAFTATAGVTGPGGLSQSVPVVYSGDCVNVTSANGCTATATFAGDANHDGSTDTKSITITPATATVNVTGFTGTYDGAAHGASGSATGVGGVDLSALLNLGASFTNVPGGTANWTFNAGSTNPNYASTSGAAAIVINKATSTTVVTFEAGPYVYRGSEFTATANVTGAGGLSQSVPVVSSGDCVNVTSANGCTATATFAGDSNHDDSTDTKSITITPAMATVEVTGFTGTYDGAAHGASGSATGVGGVDLSALLNLGASFTNVPGGTANWTFNAGSTNPNYASTSGTVAIVINKAASTTTTVGAGPFTYDGTTHAGGSGTVTGAGGLSTSATSLTYTGDQVNPGTYYVTAHYAGDANHEASDGAAVAIAITYGLCSPAVGPGGVILQPINSDGTSVFSRKGGSTIPVKFRVCDAAGNPISNLSAVFAGTGGSLTMLGAVRGTIDVVNEPGIMEVPDAAFRFSGDQWIFNMATSNLVQGSTYTFRINLASGSIQFRVGVK